MKKILRRIFLGIVAIIVIAVAVGIIRMQTHVEKDVRVTMTDPEGNSYVAYIEDNGETLARVTDENGELWKAQINADGSVGEKVEKDTDHKAEDLTTTKYTGPEIDVSNDVTAFAGDVSEGGNGSQGTQAAPTTTTGSATTATNGGSNSGSTTTAANGGSNGSSTSTTAAQKPAGQTTTQQNTANEPNIIRYQKMFASGTYYMEFTTNDEELGDTPIVTAAKNGNILITTSIEGMKCEMLYLADKDKTYLVLNDYKKYCSVPEDLMGDDFDMSEMSLADKFGSDVSPNAITTDTVTINGKSLTRESYETADGAKMSYYFDNGTLVRLDNNTDGEAPVETYITKVTNDVPDSTFDIPKGYGYLNLSWLNAFVGD